MAEYIDKWAFLASLWKMPIETRNFKNLHDAIENYAVAEVTEVRYGKWIKHPTIRERDKCSVCGIGADRRKYGTNPDGSEWMTIEMFQYCPWCGARMEAEDG